MNASIKKLAVGSAIVVILSSVTALAQPSERSADQPITLSRRILAKAKRHGTRGGSLPTPRDAPGHFYPIEHHWSGRSVCGLHNRRRPGQVSRSRHA